MSHNTTVPAWEKFTMSDGVLFSLCMKTLTCLLLVINQAKIHGLRVGNLKDKVSNKTYFQSGTPEIYSSFK